MKEYIKTNTTLKERLLFLFTGIIGKINISDDKPGKREIGRTYTKYPILPDPQGPPPPAPEYNPCVPDKPTPPPKKKKSPPKSKNYGSCGHTPAPKRPKVIVIKEEKMLDIPFFDFVDGDTKSNI
jgi:hypothetical protein